MNLKQALQKEISERSFYHFTILAFKNELDPLTNYKDNWHVKILCDYAQQEIERIAKGEKKTGDMLVNIPPRSLKSIIFSVCLNAWAWIKYPHLKFITTSHSSSLSLTLSGDTQRLIESEWYQLLWSDSFEPDKKDWGKGRFKNSEGGVRIATSVGSKILGEGADVIIIDDPQDPAGHTGDAERIQVIEYNDKTLSTRLNDREIGLNILVMQRLHVGDLSGHWLKKKKYLMHFQFPSKQSENDIKPGSCIEYYQDGFFFKNRFSEKWLNDMKESLGSAGYSGQFGQRPAAREGNIFKTKWFRYFHFHELPDDAVWNYLIDSAYGEDKSQSLAIRKRKDPDFNAILAYCIHENNLYMRKISKNKLTFPEFCKFVPSFVASAGYTTKSIIKIEPKASGKSIVQELKAKTSLNVAEYDSDTLRDSKETRANAISPTVESGRVYLMIGEDWDDFLDNVSMFPNIVHDDDVDTFIMAVETLSKPQNAPLIVF